MQISCIHCGGGLEVSPEMLGSVATCPHCAQEIQLPKAGEEDKIEGAGIVAFIDGSISGVLSMVFNMGLILILALITYGGDGVAGDGEDTQIGSITQDSLNDSDNDDELSNEDAEETESAEELDESLELEALTEAADDLAIDSFVMSPTATAGGAGDFDFSGGGPSGASGESGSWDGMIQSLRNNGLDVVIVFDSTGSMGGEIREVKDQISDIGNALTKLVPKARISICTYRDHCDAYLVKGLPLTGDIQEISHYLDDIRASGGGDRPEAVEEGLRWTIQNNEFRPRAKKVILLFGDAPPHDDRFKECLELASDFNSQNGGIVSTVTCRHRTKMSEFVEIAQVGGGEAFLTTDQRQIMTELLVLVFGSKHRGKVLEAFKLMGSGGSSS